MKIFGLTRLKVTQLWIGWPKEYMSVEHPREIPVGERMVNYDFDKVAFLLLCKYFP